MSLARVNFALLPVEDFQRARDFYRDIMGVTVQTDADYGPQGRWVFMEIPGAATKVHFVPRAELPVAANRPALYLVCDDADAETARLRMAGVHVHSGPADAPWDASVRWAMITDSEGNLVLLQSSQSEGA